jgi:hypothetical protein
MIRSHNIDQRFPKGFPKVLLIYLAPVLVTLTRMKLSKTFLPSIFVYPLAWALLSFNLPAQSTGYAIQIASTASQSEAEAIVDELKAKGVEAYLLKAVVPRRGIRYRVRIGRFSTQLEAKEAGERALRRGFISEFIVTTYDPPAKDEQKPIATEAPAAKEPSRVLIDDASADVPTSAASEDTRETAGDYIPPADALRAMIDLAVDNRNWRVARRGAAADRHLKAVYFVDSITGWVAGDDGVAFRTTDGGRSWKPLLSGAPAEIDFIYFADWSNGWMLGELDENKEAGRLLFTTNNGGRSWRHKPLPKVVSLHFIDKLTGWAVGRDATALKTTDGGEEWTRITGFEQLVGLPVASSAGNFGLRDVFFL